MINNKIKKYWLISGTLGFVILFAFLVVEIYTRTLEDEKKDYQQQQLEMAKSAASGIIYFIDHLANDLKFLSTIPEIKNLKLSSLGYLDELLLNYEYRIVNSIFIADLKGTVVHQSGKTFPEWADKYIQSLIIYGGENFLISEVIRNDETKNNSDIIFILMLPLLNKEKFNTDTSGYLGFLINFNSLIDQFIKPLKLSKDDFAWIMDNKGRLIYHPYHEEMLFNSVQDTSSECLTCHNSFEAQQNLIAANIPASGEYSVIGDEPGKVMAYYPIKIQNQKWVLVISAFVTKVTENLRAKFRIFFFLGFLILGVVLFFSLLVYYINLKRVRAEEARKNLEQVQLYQEQLNQASKMASIGELVDSVAHEINTPAGIISAHIDGLLLKEIYSDNISNVLSVIKRQTQRISDYTRSLLNYSQRMSFNPELTDLINLLEECVYLLEHRFKAKQIKIIRNYDRSVPEIFIDRRQMEQVFINIINNAVDALGNRGEIKLTLIQNKDTVCISISDNGTGINREDINKIFNPFFSTKLKSNGTGLGLSIAKAIISRHNGKITVESAPGAGTTFHLFFPVKNNFGNISQ